ncbi:MAG: outer membrane beta-barrel protein [Ginsengibacter sp.]
MIRKILATCVVLNTFYVGFSQTNNIEQIKSDTIVPATIVSEEAKPATTITGSVDVYYRYNFANVPGYLHSNNFTSFTNSQNSFELGMASIKADHNFGKASATIDLGFGRRAEEFSYADPGHSTLFAAKQAYLSYAISDKFKLTMGKWATHIGYELVDAYLNRNYSMSYMFSYGPFSHTGLKADIGLGGKSTLMVGVANTSDTVSSSVSPKFLIGQFGTASADNKFKAYLNFQAGSNASFYKLVQGDIVLTYALTDKFNVGYNGTLQSRKIKDNITNKYADAKSWWGSALYFNYDPESTFGLTLRGEYFSDKKSVLGLGTSIFDLTLSPNIKAGNLTIIPELRLDAAKGKIFEKNDGTTKSTVTGILAATYHF